MKPEDNTQNENERQPVEAALSSDPMARFDRRADELIDELAKQLAESEFDFAYDPEMWLLTAAKALLSDALRRESDLEQRLADPDPCPDSEDAAMWAIARDGADPLSSTSATVVTGYNNGDRGRIAMHFAQDDDAGWASDGTYDEKLRVRRCKPNPESDGASVRVRVDIESEATP